MSEEIIQKLQEAEAQLIIFNEQKAQALAALETWREIDKYREDGSIRQDRLHEEFGKQYEIEFGKASRNVADQQVLVDELKKL